MRCKLLLFVAALSYYSGLLALIRWIDQRRDKRLIIVNYHRASGGNLRQHFLYLQQHFRIMPLEDALDELYQNDASIQNQARKREKQRIPVAITFDDGYEDNYTHALPLAQELRVPLTLFLITGFIDDETVPECQLQNRRINWVQAMEMGNSGLITFGGHTVHHPILSQVTNSNMLLNEVGHPREALRERLGTAPRIFAYPFGGTQHISEQAVQAAQATGYSWAVTTIPGFNTSSNNPFLLQRISEDVQHHWLLVALMTSSLGNILAHIFRGMKRFVGIKVAADSPIGSMEQASFSTQISVECSMLTDEHTSDSVELLLDMPGQDSRGHVPNSTPR